MIANFVLMGELYQHNPFDTEAAPWNTYPWHIGADNGLEYATSLQQFAMAKTIWRIDENPAAQGLAITDAALGDFSMFATLILLDHWGNIGSDVGNDPNPIPPEELTGTLVGAAMIASESQPILVVANSNVEQPDEQGFTSLTSATMLSSASVETLVVRDSYQEQPNEQGFISVTSAAVLSVTSNTVVTEETIVDLPMQGADGQDVFVDSTTGKTYTNNGGVSLLNNEAVFNGSSYLSANDGFSLGGDFEISFDVKVDSFDNHAGYFLFGDENQDSLRIQLSSNDNRSLTFFASDNAGGTLFSAAAGSSALLQGVYHNIKCQKIGSTASLFVDGVLKASATYSGAPTTFSDRVNIGIARSSSTQRFLNGKIKNFVTKVFT